jgi:hypothetical protein
MLRKTFVIQKPIENFAVPIELFLKDVSEKALQSYQGSYVGTGKSGKKVTFPFSPKIVVISPYIDVGRTGDTTTGNMLFALSSNVGVTWVPGTGFVKNAVISFQNDGFTLGSNADCNTNGTNYIFLAVG